MNKIHEIIDKVYPEHEIDLNMITSSLDELKKEIDRLKKTNH